WAIKLPTTDASSAGRAYVDAAATSTLQPSPKPRTTPSKPSYWRVFTFRCDIYRSSRLLAPLFSWNCSQTLREYQ
ncbi:hypothetical protein J6590_011741, partial [Homalodisca vitripennis]